MQTFLKENADELALIEVLNLNGKNLISLPKEIGLFVNLKALDIAGNQLRELPSEISQLKQLTTLNAISNRLMKLPEEIKELTALKYLFLSNNTLCFLPLEIGDLSSLQQLWIENNQLLDLPKTIGNLNNLKLLYLYNNQITRFPDEIGRMQSLQILSAAKNLLVELPDAIGNLDDLQILTLDNNSLSILPDTLASLKNLRELYVNNNQLEELPKLLVLKYLGCEGNPFIPEGNGIAGIDEKEFQFFYNLLGDEKWKECIDGIYHSFGKNVFDLGLHRRETEPGFLASMLDVFQFLPDNYSRRVDASFYLDLHKVACSHFDGANTQTLIGQEKVGVFREESVKAILPSPHYSVSPEAMAAFSELNKVIATILGPSFCLGNIFISSWVPLQWTIYYNQMTSEQIEIVFNLFLSEFYTEINTATNDDEKLIAIAKLIQHLEWLHPPKDGCGRTDTALLNFLLTKYGFNPVLLDYPYISTCRGLIEWTSWLKKGMEEWWKVAANKL
jgi:hypothetical protein